MPPLISRLAYYMIFWHLHLVSSSQSSEGDLLISTLSAAEPSLPHICFLWNLPHSGIRQLRLPISLNPSAQNLEVILVFSIFFKPRFDAPGSPVKWGKMTKKVTHVWLGSLAWLPAGIQSAPRPLQAPHSTSCPRGRSVLVEDKEGGAQKKTNKNL